MDNAPQVLYKYFGPERISVLSERLVRYTPLGAFNDPFEGRPEITALTTESYARETLNASLPLEARSAYDALTPQQRSVLPYELWERLLSGFMKAREPELQRLLQAATEPLSKMLTSKFDEILGAFCLSEVPDSLLMWSHYGASHSGFVLCFDGKHPYFNGARGPDDELRHLRRVIYREARPSAALTEFEGADIFLVKSGHWAYEREWRVLRALQEADAVVPAVPFPVHLFRFPPSSLKEVIIGARASVETRSVATATLRADAELAHVKLRSARPDESHFLLRIADGVV